MPDKNWDQIAIQQLIDDQIQESLSLEYKAADALNKSDGKMKEITKDISAMANSSGGTIIYGIKEYDTPGQKHLPEKITPIDQVVFSKEWLEQVINNIRPRINGLTIYPVPVKAPENHVIYIVEIPQSSTAHQATDYRYYKRYNFQSIPMEDYEVRDTMGRLKYPKFDLDFWIEISTEVYHHEFDNLISEHTNCVLKIVAKNIGGIYAQYINSFIQVPIELLNDLTIEQINKNKEEYIEIDGRKYYEFFKDNTERDIVDFDRIGLSSIPKYGPSRYDPILPGLIQTWNIILNEEIENLKKDDLTINWSLYTDNAPVNNGFIALSKIKIIKN